MPPSSAPHSIFSSSDMKSRRYCDDTARNTSAIAATCAAGGRASGPGRRSIHRQVQLLQQAREARIAVQVAERDVVLQGGQARVVLGMGPLQPLERFVALAEPGVDLADLVGAGMREAGDQRIERAPRFGS